MVNLLDSAHAAIDHVRRRQLRRVMDEADIPPWPIAPDDVDYGVAPQELEVRIARRTLARVFCRGSGIEVGAGTRPWPLPRGASCFYGDVRDEVRLAKYFSEGGSAYQGFIDAQTFAGIADAAFDFALSAHVLEHLINPIGAIEAALRVVRPGGIFMLAVPDMRYTWDKPRPVTPLDHLISDYATGGEDTRHIGVREHIKYLHPQWAPPIAKEEVEATVARMVDAKIDTHYHTWTSDTFDQMIAFGATKFGAEILHAEIVLNENIAVLRRPPSMSTRATGRRAAALRLEHASFAFALNRLAGPNATQTPATR
jgi:SAM-dependent methyltransferase